MKQRLAIEEYRRDNPDADPAEVRSQEPSSWKKRISLQRDTRIEWKKVGYGGKVSSKKHLRVSQYQEGVRTFSIQTRPHMYSM